MNFENRVFTGDCLDILRTMPDECCAAVVCDPPYGLGRREPTLPEIVAYLRGELTLDTKGDFMGADWSIPPVAVWKECLRVLKPGGHLLSFAGTRTMHFIGMGVQAAGFTSSDTVATQLGTTVLQWLNSQGFPKSLNISRALEKRGAPPEVVERWKGWGSALKPAWEPVLVFRKPVEGQTLGERGRDAAPLDIQIDQHRSVAFGPGVILMHAPGCKVVGSKKVQVPVMDGRDDADAVETIPVYECDEGCPVALLDGRLASGPKPAVRSFGQITPEAPFLYTSKASRSQRRIPGLPENKHPTVKPLALMVWLVRLVVPVGGLVLDPFAGSGTTMEAAVMAGCRFVGIEKDPEYADYARQRAQWALDNPAELRRRARKFKVKT